MSSFLTQAEAEDRFGSLPNCRKKKIFKLVRSASEEFIRKRNAEGVRNEVRTTINPEQSIRAVLNETKEQEIARKTNLLLDEHCRLVKASINRLNVSICFIYNRFATS